MTDLKVVVLGCGPAGLIAAHSAAQAGADVRILSTPRKSHMRGAQYLHMPIPDVPADRFRMDYTLLGTPEQYRAKVYGAGAEDFEVSPESLEEEHHAWDIRQAYDYLWDTYGQYVHAWHASIDTLRALLKTWEPDLVVSSVPRPLFCAGTHTFSQQTIFSTDQDIGYLPKNRDNVVVCNGEESPSWYRLARVHGWDTVEWSGRKPPFSPMWDVVKPISHNCNCVAGILGNTAAPPMYLEVGRYGVWKKGVLSHEAYGEVATCIRSLQ